MSVQNLPISAIIIAKNEEKNIARCLDSLRFLPEVVVIDGHSTDQTATIAQQYANVVCKQSPWLGYSATKRLAVSHTSHPWVLWIDADAEVSPALESAIQKLFAEGNPTAQWAYEMPRKTFFMGEWVAHTGWYPGYVTRLFQKSLCDFNDNLLHEGVEVPQEHLGRLSADLMHYSYVSLYQYFDKMNVYGKYGAEEMMRKGKKLKPYKIIFSPIASFMKFYFMQKGFLDGKKGLIISIGSAFSTFIKYVNFYYLKTKGKIDQF